MLILKEKQHPNLSSVEGTFASIVEFNSNELARLINDDDITVEEVKDYVFEMMENCKQTPWIRKARVRMERMQDKRELTFFIYNSVLSADNLDVLTA